MTDRQWWRERRCKRRAGRWAAVIAVELVAVFIMLISTTASRNVEPDIVMDSVIIITPAPTEISVPLSYTALAAVAAYCAQYELPVALVLALIEVESEFQSGAVSGTNDYGLMQINSYNFEWLGEELGLTDFLNEEQNIHAGCFILWQAFQQAAEFGSGTTEEALMIYNMGLSGAMEQWEQGVFSTAYTDKILEAMEKYD